MSLFGYTNPDILSRYPKECLECQVQAYCSLWVKSISVATDSVGLAAPGAAQ